MMKDLLKKSATLILLSFVICIYTLAQNYTISGYITDAEDGEALIGVNIFDKRTLKGTVTNFYGFYSLTLPSDSVEILFSFIGYNRITKEFHLKSDQQFNIPLTYSASQLEEVEVVASASEVENVNSTQMSAFKIKPSEISTVPTLGGEADVIKVIQLMPGVSKGSEGGTGMYVRGGSHDQNLVILDEATVYNLGHLFGFFSIFNNDAIKDVTIIKGGFPANYGGRLSSVLDIRMKEGNTKKYKVDGGIGLLSSRITIQGPIKNERMSFIISGRRTYIDKLFKSLGSTLPYYFYDLNAKVNYKISDKDRVFFSSYFGNDVLSLNEESEEGEDPFGFGFNLGNFTTTLRWNHLYNNKLFSNLSLIHTRFKYEIEGNFIDNSIYIGSKISDIGLKADYDYYINPENHLKFGLHFTSHLFRPNVISTSGEISNYLKSRDNTLLTAQEFGLYASNDYDFNRILKINYGLRISSSIVPDKFYGDLEPRFSARYSLSEVSSIKASYTRMKQYMHLVSSSTVTLPTDLWYPVTKNVKPLRADQVALGFFHNINKYNTLVSIEAYYKWMKNLIAYREGAKLILNDNFENELLTGDGDAYGMEFLIRKTAGKKLTGWIGYTLSWSTRDFDELNNGKRYWAKYDRRHDISIVAMYKLGKRWDFSAVWVYSTGSRFTAQTGQFFMPNAALTKIDVLRLYSDRYAVQMSPSHRLDFNFIRHRKPGKKYQHEWHFGCYNFYNRATPYRINVVGSQSGGYKYQQPGLFGFLPFVAYNFKF